MATCTLCDLPVRGEPVVDPTVEGEFCCRGCLEAYRRFGDVPPAELDDGSPDVDAVPEDADTAYLDVRGMHCTTCEAFVERIATDREGVYDAEARYATETMKLTFDPDAVREEELPSLVSRLGYRASASGEADGREDENRVLVARLRTVVGLFGAMAVMSLYVLFLYPTYLGIYSESFLYERATTLMVFGPLPVLTAFVLLLVGYPILRGAYVSLKTGQPNMDVLVAFGATAAYVYSIAVLLAGGRVVYFDVTVVVVAVVTAGNYVESKIKRRAVGTLADLGSRRVTEARVAREDGVETVAVEAVDPGDEVLVNRGERVPVDGVVRAGAASVDEALISGESTPRPVEPGDDVIGGAVVLDGHLTIEVGADATSTLDRIVSQMWNIKSSGASAQRLADRIATVFVPAVLVLAVGVAVVDLALGEALAAAVLTGVSVLVVSCPCSFGLATPLAIAAGVSHAADRGIVVTNAATLQRISDVDVVALDKTGTLTTREMEVVDVSTAGEVDESALLDRAAALEATATHPVADAIVAAADAADAAVSDVDSRPRGVAGTVDGDGTLVGHPSLFATGDWTVPDALRDEVEARREAGTIATVVGWNGVARGVVSVRDDLRDGWADAVAELAATGATVVVLTGDDQSSVRPFESHPDVDDVFTGMTPQAKAETVRRLRTDEGTVAMVGDGINDAPALAAADLGVAVADGSALASDAAAVTVIDRDLDALLDLVGVGRRMRRRVRQNFGWALAYNAVALPLAVAGAIDPLVAAVAMAASSVLVVVNSAR